MEHKILTTGLEFILIYFFVEIPENCLNNITMQQICPIVLILSRTYPHEMVSDETFICVSYNFPGMPTAV